MVRSRNGLEQEEILAALQTWHAPGNIEMAYIRDSCKGNFDSLKPLQQRCGEMIGVAGLVQNGRKLLSVAFDAIENF